jgi:tetratricopeptide (TPR) repeat protein
MAKSGREFIEELAMCFREEIVTRFEDFPNPTNSISFFSIIESVLKTRFKELLFYFMQALDDSSLCLDCAYFLHLSDLLAMGLGSNWLQVDDWLRKASEKYQDDAFLAFLRSANADTILYGAHPEPQITKIAESIRRDPEDIIHAVSTHLKLTETSWERHPVWSKSIYEISGKEIFPDVKEESYFSSIMSFLHAKLGSYYTFAGQKEKSEKEFEKAITLYEDNSFALVRKGFIMIDQDSIEAEYMFNKALKLVDNQFNGMRSIRRNIKVIAFAGLAEVHRRRGVYDLTETYINKALEMQPPSYIEANLLLNRGVNKIDKKDLIGAISDLKKATNDPSIAPLAHMNLGSIYIKQGLHEKAESELTGALDAKPDLSDAYYNLGVLYNVQGDRERAKKLFQTAYQMDRNKKSLGNRTPP